MLFNTVFALAAVASVSAHGWINKFKVGDKTYNGVYPFDNKPGASPVRKITTTSPIKNANDGSMNCGIGASKAPLVAVANPGDKITISWRSTGTKNWGHTLGPMLTYLAQVPAGQTADKYDTKKAKFFKIAQAGQSGSKWVQASLKDGKSYSLTLPSNLPAGDYIMRHEIIALHFAYNAKNGAQFYPQCIQLRVGGGSKSPKAVTGAQTVSFPGGYTPNDKSLYVPHIFEKGYKYPMPGPALYTGKSSRAIPASPCNSTHADTESESKRSVIVPEAHHKMVKARME